jgi:hypothetical protein
MRALSNSCGFLDRAASGIRQLPASSGIVGKFSFQTITEGSMTNSGDFENRFGRSIQESIAVKQLLVSKSHVVSVIAKVSGVLVDAFQEATRWFCLATAEVPRTRSTSLQNWSGGLRWIVKRCRLFPLP